MAAEIISIDRAAAPLGMLLELVITDMSSNGKFSCLWIDLYQRQYRVTAEYMAASLGGTIDTVTVAAAVNGEKDFLQYIASLKAETISRHKGRRVAILQYAEQFGILVKATLELEWDAISRTLNFNNRCAATIIKYAISHDVRVADFSQQHLAAWELEATANGLTPKQITVVVNAFGRAITDGMHEAKFNFFDPWKRVKSFSFFLDDMRQSFKSLHANVTELVAWADAEAADGNFKIGASIVGQLEALCGFAINVLRMQDVESIDPLLTEEFLRKYVTWLAEVRECKRPAISNRLGGLHTILRFHPHFEHTDISWWPTLLDQIEHEPKSAIDARRDNRNLMYVDLLTIPFKMRDQRMAAGHLDSEDISWRVHDEALVAVAVLLLWEPLLIRTCTLDGPTPNLFKTSVPADRPFLALTPAAKKAYRTNKDALLWQFDFEKEMGVGAYGFVIKQVVPFISEFIDEHRAILLGDQPDPGTCFFNRKLQPLTKYDLNMLIRRVTGDFAEKPVAPSSIRSCFIDYWLLAEDNDFVSLANLLMISLESVHMRFDENYKKPPQGKI